MENRTRSKQFILRVTEEEHKKIKKKIEKSKLKQNEYLLKCALDKEIIVIEDLQQMVLETKRIGNNINQLAKTVNQGRIVNGGQELLEIKEELKEVWQLLRLLIQKQV